MCCTRAAPCLLYTSQLNAGDSIYFNPTYPHGQRCNGDVPCKFITIIAE